MSRQRRLRQRWLLRPLLTTSQRRQQHDNNINDKVQVDYDEDDETKRLIHAIRLSGISVVSLCERYSSLDRRQWLSWGHEVTFFDQRQQTKLKSEILFTFKNVFLVKSTQRRHFNGRASASVPEMMVGPYKQSGIYSVRTMRRRRLVPWHIHNYTYICMKEHINYIIYLMFKLSGGKLAIILWLYVSEDEFLWFLNLPPTTRGDFELLSVIDNDRCLFFGRSGL